MAKALKTLVPNGHVLTFDCRGHGQTKTQDDFDLSLDTLSKDLLGVLMAAYPQGLPSEIILVGHRWDPSRYLTNHLVWEAR